MCEANINSGDLRRALLEDISVLIFHAAHARTPQILNSGEWPGTPRRAMSGDGQD